MTAALGTGSPPAILRVPAGTLTRPTPWLRRITQGEVAAVVFEGTFDAEVVRRAVAVLEREDPTWMIDDPDPSARLKMVGGLISPRRSAPRGPHLEEYLTSAAASRAACVDVFGSSPDWFETIETLFALASGAEHVAVAATPDGRPYVATSIRGLAPGASFPPHCEAGYLGIPAYDPLRESVCLDQKMGYFALLAKPDAGGQLVIYDRTHAENVHHFQHRPSNIDDSVPHTVVTMDPGDVVVLAAGQRYHQVTEVRGTQARWSMGGFAAYARRGDALLYWT